MRCRSCQSNSLKSIIPLGKLPLANALIEKTNVEKSKLYNLEVMLCEECALVQLKDSVAPEDLFSHYFYFSSNSSTMLESAQNLVESLLPQLNEDSQIVEIASNDGYLLKNYMGKGFKVLGIEPAKNVAKVARESGIETLCEFFDANLAKKIAHSGMKADIIHANNVMAHVPDINSFVKGVKILLKQTGVAVIEVPYFLDLIEKLEFDTIYHEHVFYFTLKALKGLFNKNGLLISGFEKLKIHGGSLRLFIAHEDNNTESADLEGAIFQEELKGLYNLETYKGFMRRLEDLKENLLDKLQSLKNDQKKIAAYGASAKGTTLLNYFGIRKELIDFVVDKSSAKIGKLLPGTYLEIKNPEALIEEDVDTALLLTWNFAEEILKEQQKFLDKNKTFLCPLPYVREIS
ncbi:C-methyltransferase NovU [Chlamydiales bacterium SCGC AB-751-O23]|jgi:SAM-dependent methyltransferase|nr:C-methyltransferase NovU [Chlamydiales bacterium SCGC AB-751-O23]